MKKVLIVGSGNAALCAGISAIENGAKVTIIEAASAEHAGGNSKYTAGAMRFVYDKGAELIPLLAEPKDARISKTDFGSYPSEKFEEDLLSFNNGGPLSEQQKILVDKSKNAMQWLASHGVKFDPIYSRQSFEDKGKHVFWGGLTLAASGEGVGLVEAELGAFEKMGGEIIYNCRAESLVLNQGNIIGLKAICQGEEIRYQADAVVLGCGGFEANPEMRAKYIGKNWTRALVRGSKYNLGAGIQMALDCGAALEGNFEGCHAVPMDMNMPNFGNPNIPYIERKKYRKICYFLGVMLNRKGHRFVDEGLNFRNYTYAQYGRAILEQPDGFAWQIFDSKVEPLLYDEYRFWDASYEEADTLEGLIQKMTNIEKEQALQTLNEFNEAVEDSTHFNPSVLDGKRTQGLELDKTNWANKLDNPPFKAYPVRCGITFTYGGLRVDKHAAVLKEDGSAIPGLFACGELVGGVFYFGYPGGSGLTSGAVFGRLAGQSAAS